MSEPPARLADMEYAITRTRSERSATPRRRRARSGSSYRTRPVSASVACNSAAAVGGSTPNNCSRAAGSESQYAVGDAMNDALAPEVLERRPPRGRRVEAAVSSTTRATDIEGRRGRGRPRSARIVGNARMYRHDLGSHRRIVVREERRGARGQQTSSTYGWARPRECESRSRRQAERCLGRFERDRRWGRPKRRRDERASARRAQLQHREPPSEKRNYATAGHGRGGSLYAAARCAARRSMPPALSARTPRAHCTARRQPHRHASSTTPRGTTNRERDTQGAGAAARRDRVQRSRRRSLCPRCAYRALPASRAGSRTRATGGEQRMRRGRDGNAKRVRQRWARSACVRAGGAQQRRDTGRSRRGPG